MCCLRLSQVFGPKGSRQKRLSRSMRNGMRYPKNTDNSVECSATELLYEACVDHFQWAERGNFNPMSSQR
jgi:hypothetical protein